jgi:4-diphosphocytidyl-2-C-methyl-D-erythritol kinase
VLAQAKINLWLKIGARDSSGYHEIRTIFQRVDLADEITVRVGGHDRAISCTGPRLPAVGLGPPERNLAFRAAGAYAEITGWPRGLSIDIVKHIPVRGGLGGGSADAAAVLRSLDALAARPIGSARLLEIGRSLGADVPFLASDRVGTYAEGRGDQLGPSLSLPSLEVLLVIPDVGVSTADAYRWFDEAGVTRSTPMPTDAEVKQVPSWDFVAGFSRNDFEPVVEQRLPQLAMYRRRLEEKGAKVARLSGSGSTVFGVFEGRAPASEDLALDADVIPTRTSSRVVQVEVLE